MIAVLLPVLGAGEPIPAPSGGEVVVPNVMPLLISAVISTGVLAALVTGLFTWLSHRTDAKVAERRDAREGETEQVAAYRDMAEQARKSAETAVSVIQHSLESTVALVDNLQATVASLNETIRQMTAAANVQHDALDRMTVDRDRTQEALHAAQQLLAEQTAERARLTARLDGRRPPTTPVTIMEAAR